MSIFDNVTFMNEADSNKVTKADYLKKKQQRAEEAEEEAHKYYNMRTFDYIDSEHKDSKTAKNDRDYRDRAGTLVDIERVKRHREYDNAMDRLNKYDKMNPVSVPDSVRPLRRNAYIRDERDKDTLRNELYARAKEASHKKDNIYHAGASDTCRAAKRYLKKQDKKARRAKTESAGIFESVEIV